MRLNPFRDLVSLASSISSGAKGLILVLKACFDESYQGNGRVMSIAGYISSEKRWSQFERHWRERVLKPFGLKAFHMVDCEQGHREFEDWPRERREEAKNIALTIIRAWTLRGGALGLVVADFERLLDDLHIRHKTRNAELREPYAWCFFGALRSCLAYSSEDPSHRPVVVFFDQKEKVVGQSLTYYNKYVEKHDPQRHFLRGIVHKDDESFPPLQAADVLAYEATKHLHSVLFSPSEPTRENLKVLNMKNNIRIGFDDRKSLLPVIERMKREGRL